MIGGYYICLKGTATRTDVWVFLQQIHEQWRTAVVQATYGEPTDGDQTLSLESAYQLVVTHKELFIYQDRASARSWARDGSTPDNRPTMIHLIRHAEGLTAVVDREGSPSMELVTQAFRAVEHHRKSNLPTGPA